jgi:hypothetical protein
VVQVVAAALTAFAPLLDGLARMFQDVMRKMVAGILFLIGALAHVFGADGFLAQLIRSLSGEDRGQGLAARLRNPHITDLRGIANELALASAQAGAGGQQRTDNQWLQEITAALRDIHAGNVNYLEAIRNFTGTAAGLLGSIFEFLRGVVAAWRQGGEALEFIASHPADALRLALGDFTPEEIRLRSAEERARRSGEGVQQARRRREQIRGIGAGAAGIAGAFAGGGPLAALGPAWLRPHQVP